MGKFLRPSKASLRNPQHYEFFHAFLTALADAGLSAAKITSLIGQLTAAFNDEDRWYMISRSSEIIAQRDAADRRRGTFYMRLHKLVTAWAGSGNPTFDAPATLLKKDFDLYKVQTGAQLEVESGQMSNLITELLKPDRQEALATLNGQYLFTEMKSSNELVKSLRLDQGVEVSQRVYGALPAARKVCDRLYDELTYLIEAFSKTADDASVYEAFITRWNGTLKIYQDMLSRKQGSAANGESAGQGGQSGQGGQTTTPDDTTNPSQTDTPGTTEPGTGGSDDGEGGTDTPTPPENPGGGSNDDAGDGME